MEENDLLQPVSPGEILREEFLQPLGLTQADLAHRLGVTPRQIGEIVNNRRRLSGDLAIRLGLFFKTSPEFWMNLQTHYDIEVAKDAIAPEIAAAIAAQRAA